MLKWLGSFTVVIVELVKGAGQKAKDNALKLLTIGIFIIMVAIALSIVLESSNRSRQSQEQPTQQENPPQPPSVK